jgi:putative ubiquitin-RnfH superfamily antitoxin RatB of RatAB toxin-antitoxin module
MSEDISVEVVYALPQKQEVLSLKIRSGAVVSEAIERSGILRDFPEIDLASAKVGIYSKQVKLDAVLRDKDRIEIYRPLIADPKEIRRKRAAEGKEMKNEAGDAEAAPT